MSLTLVLDIGKTHAKLVLIDTEGQVLAHRVHANASEAAPGYLALGIEALEAWLRSAVPQLPMRTRIQHLSITTHGAAFCALGDQGLALPAMDYEWDGYGAHRQAFHSLASRFEETGSPDLPLGLNAGLQLSWLKARDPQAWSQVRHIVPYPQYWGWWFTGHLASEVTSLGCHTHLWAPRQGQMSSWAQAEGFDRLFPALKPAWGDLGTLTPQRSAELGLPAGCRVGVGVHDSNACLARYLHTVPGATMVSTGTWCVVMATHGQAVELDEHRDELLNVSVDGAAIPTGRFMGGREFAHLADGADPSLATTAALQQLQDGGWHASPSFVDSGGPFAGQAGQIWHEGRVAPLSDVPFHLRPALGAMYAAEVTTGIVQRLDGATPAPVILEGPLARNAAFVAHLGARLGERPIWRSTDDLEGTARGAWMLADWPRRRQTRVGLKALSTP